MCIFFIFPRCYSFIVMWFASILSIVCFVIQTFMEQKFLTSMKFNISGFSFTNLAFGMKSKNTLPSSRTRDFSTFFKIKILQFYNYILKFVIHFELILYKLSDQVRVHFFAYGHPIVPASFVENIILLPLNCFCIFVTNRITVFVQIYFWVLSCVPLIYVFISLSIPHCPDCYGYKVIFNIRKSDFSHFILLC